MKKLIGLVAALQCASILCTAEQSTAQSVGGDMLNEVPIWPVPAEMTLEEYRDANRRLGVGLMLLSVPLPGALHFYADEPREGWMHVGAAGLGVVSIILGAAMIDEKDNQWEKSDLEVVDVTGANGTVERYEKVPMEEEAGVFTYRLKKLDRKMKGGAGIPFVILGAGLVVGQLFHDWIDGVKTIERKRDAVRYKYGKTVDPRFSMGPTMDTQRGRYGAQLSYHF